MHFMLDFCSSFMLTVICLFSNMFIKVRMFRFSGPTVHLKLEGLSWFPSPGLQIFARLEAYSMKSLEYQLNVLIMYSSWLPRRVETQHRTGWWHMLAVAWNRDIIFLFVFWFKVSGYWHITPNNFLLKFQFFNHISFVCLFCCDHILTIGFAQAFSCLFSWKPSFDFTSESIDLSWKQFLMLVSEFHVRLYS